VIEHTIDLHVDVLAVKSNENRTRCGLVWFSTYGVWYYCYVILL